MAVEPRSPAPGDWRNAAKSRGIGAQLRAGSVTGITHEIVHVDARTAAIAATHEPTRKEGRSAESAGARGCRRSARSRVAPRTPASSSWSSCPTLVSADPQDRAFAAVTPVGRGQPVDADYFLARIKRGRRQGAPLALGDAISRCNSTEAITAIR